MNRLLASQHSDSKTPTVTEMPASRIRWMPRPLTFAIICRQTLKFFKDENLSVLKIKLETGRHHQIRVQLSNKMHAIYGDVKYHGRSSKDFLYLWAYKLSFKHPVTKEMLTFTCLPESKGKWKLLKQIDNL